MEGRTRFGRLLLAVGLVALLGGAAFAAPGSHQSSAAPIEAKVLHQLATSGRASFWIVLRDKADLRAAAGIQNRARRGRFVYTHLTGEANRSQARLRNLLHSRGVRYQPFWIVNAIRVKSAGRSILETVDRLPEVKEILATRVYRMPKPIKVPAGSRPSTTEWGLNSIHAPQVWSNFNDRGEGIVVANIDTGVRYSHQALVMQYRGRNPDGTFDHNYNWWDPLHECSGNIPCDTDAHGTHTMGTIASRPRAAASIRRSSPPHSGFSRRRT